METSAARSAASMAKAIEKRRKKRSRVNRQQRRKKKHHPPQRHHRVRLSAIGAKQQECAHKCGQRTQSINEVSHNYLSFLKRKASANCLIRLEAFSCTRFV